MKFLGKFFDSSEKQLGRIRALSDEVLKLEPEMQGLSHEQILAKTNDWKNELKTKNYEEKIAILKRILPEAFALVREAAARTLEKRHYAVQIMAGISLHEGKIAEQKTGEGKTLTATLPLYLNALTGDGVHLVTPNDYLSSHHAAWMGPVYHYLGMSTGVILQEEKAFVYDPDFDNPDFLDILSKKLRPVTRREAYSCDITYGTSHEFGFDYLRDNMETSRHRIRQTNPNGTFGAHNYVIVDEADSSLIDIARTPLIISQPAEESTQKYYQIADLVKGLDRGSDYEVEEKRRLVTLTDLGIKRLERQLGVENLYESDFETVHHVEQALKAKALFNKDRDYIVKDGKVIIIDQSTGRLLPSNRYSEGLHQAIEAKEGVEIQRESRTLAEISYQNYFRLYSKLAGMTGTALTEAEEFHKIYKLDVIEIPTHRPTIRIDHPDVVYKTESAKFKAVADDIAERYSRGQPVLVGTTSVEKSEHLHELLKRRGIPHEILNAKNNEREALIIAQAGKKSSVTVSTNMAGRGVDIILGGDPPDLSEQSEVRNLGGLHVIGTERHESRRIDLQLRGRSGRQGDPGSSRFYVSLQDDLMRIFGGQTVERLMDRFGFDENVPLESRLVTSAIENSQKRVEGLNFERRKRVVEFDDVMNQQRDVIYKLRRKILGVDEGGLNKEWLIRKLQPHMEEDFGDKWDYWEKNIGPEAWEAFVSTVSLQVVDTLWIAHLEDMDDVIEGINLRNYAQRDPLVEYRKEGHERFTKLVNEIYLSIAERITNILKSEENKGKLSVTSRESQTASSRNIVFKHGELESGVSEEASEVRGSLKVEPVKSGIARVGRNDPCPCGKTKSDGTPVKYKNCHGRGL